MKFKENQLVMYGSTGVCRVIQIGTPDFAREEDSKYYFLQPLYQSGVIYAPCDSSKVAMRALISKANAKKLLDDIENIEVEDYKSGSMQQLAQQYQEVIDKHSCNSLLGLVKSIYKKNIDAMSNNKKLGQIDKRFMKKAEELLYGEMAAALETDREEIEKYVHKAIEEIIL